MFKRSWAFRIGCLAVFWMTTVFLAYRFGYGQGSGRESREKRWWRIAAYNVKSEELGSLLLPLRVCSRNPSAFTPDERQFLRDKSQDDVYIAEKEIIPVLERGDSLEPWPIDLNGEKALVARAKKHLAEIQWDP